ncbi:MAG: hypothetical protein ACJ71T_01410 [Actinomycetales bacterium]
MPVWLPPMLCSIAFSLTALVGAAALLFKDDTGPWGHVAAVITFGGGLTGALVMARGLTLIASLVARAQVQIYELEAAAEVLETQEAQEGTKSWVPADIDRLRDDRREAVELVGRLIAWGAGQTAVDLRAAIMRVDRFLDFGPVRSPEIRGG